MHRPGRILAGVLVAASIAFAALPARAISPVLIMVYGGGLTKSIFVKDTMIFHDLANPTSIRVSGLGDQKYFDVAIFWGPRFMPYRNAQKPLTELTPEQAGQHGRLYVATPTAPAVLLQTYPRQVPVPIPADTSLYIWGGVVPDSGVERMIRAGVPVRPSR